MTENEIVIEYGETKDGKLYLRGGDRVEVGKGERVNWSIADTSNVVSFRIEKKQDSEEIFDSDDLPPTYHTTKCGGCVKQSIADGTEYIYSIYWKDSQDGKELHYDPVIAIKPAP